MAILYQVDITVQDVIPAVCPVHDEGVLEGGAIAATHSLVGRLFEGDGLASTDTLVGRHQGHCIGILHPEIDEGTIF